MADMIVCVNYVVAKDTPITKKPSRHLSILINCRTISHHDLHDPTPVGSVLPDTSNQATNMPHIRPVDLMSFFDLIDAPRYPQPSIITQGRQLAPDPLMHLFERGHRGRTIQRRRSEPICPLLTPLRSNPTSRENFKVEIPRRWVLLHSTTVFRLTFY